MAQDLSVTASYILLSALTILLYDVATHLDEEIDYVVRSKSTYLKVIFIFCRYLPIVIGVLRIPTNLVGAEVNDDKVCVALLRSTIWLCVVQMVCVEFVFLMRTYAVWGCSRRVLLVLLAFYVAICIVDVVSIQRYNASITTCDGSAILNSSALIACFASLVILEIGLCGMTLYRVLRQYRTSSGQLISLLVQHSAVFFVASVALNALNIVGLMLDPQQNRWHSDVIEIVQILFQGLLASRMQLHLWRVNGHTVGSTRLDTINMTEFAAGTRESHVATFD